MISTPKKRAINIARIGILLILIGITIKFGYVAGMIVSGVILLSFGIATLLDELDK